MTRCEAAGCSSEAMETVTAPPLHQRTRDDPEYVETDETLQACAEHATLVRQRATAPYMLRVLTRREDLQGVLDRVDAAEPGRAEQSDLAFLDTYVDDCHQVALTVEGATDPTWQAVAAQMCRPCCSPNRAVTWRDAAVDDRGGDGGGAEGLAAQVRRVAATRRC